MTGLRLLMFSMLLITLVGCTVPPSPPGGPPVVDRSSLYRPPPPAMPPPVEVNPLPRTEPLRSQQFPPPQQQQVATTAPEPEDPFANRAIPQQTPPPTPSAAAPSTAPPVQQPAAELSQGSGPVVALLDNARTHVNNQQWDKAAASLERALRIEPRNASIWHDLAQIRLQQREYQQAETLAQKSNSLASDAGVQARNWDLIAFAKRAQGDNNGADEAEARAAVLRR